MNRLLYFIFPHKKIIHDLKVQLAERNLTVSKLQLELSEAIEKSFSDAKKQVESAESSDSEKLLKQEEDIKELQTRNQERIQQVSELQVKAKEYEEIVTYLKKTLNEEQQEKKKYQQQVEKLEAHSAVVESESENTISKESKPTTSDDKDRQIANLKNKISELKSEVEAQKQITFKANQLLNKNP